MERAQRARHVTNAQQTSVLITLRVGEGYLLIHVALRVLRRHPLSVPCFTYVLDHGDLRGAKSAAFPPASVSSSVPSLLRVSSSTS